MREHLPPHETKSLLRLCNNLIIPGPTNRRIRTVTGSLLGIIVIPDGTKLLRVPSMSSTVDAEPNVAELFTERYCIREPDENFSYSSTKTMAAIEMYKQ
jgi:hypothetical protein